MRLLNSHRFGSGATPPPSLLYDNVLAMYSLRRPNMTTLWTKAVIRVSIEGTNNRRFVFFDSNGVISGSSPVSEDVNTPSATTLSTWSGTDTILLKEWYAITTDNTVNDDFILEADPNDARSPVLMVGGSFLTSNSNPTVGFQKTTIQQMTAKAQVISSFSSTGYFSIMCVTENKKSLSTGKFFTNANNGGFYLHHDTSSGKTMATIPPSSIVYINSELSVDQQRIQLMTYKPVIPPAPALVKGYYNNILQNTLSAYTSFDNEGLKIGGEAQVSSEIFQGNISEIIIMDEDVSGSYTSYFDEVNSYYQTY